MAHRIFCLWSERIETSEINASIRNTWKPRVRLLDAMQWCSGVLVSSSIFPLLHVSLFVLLFVYLLIAIWLASCMWRLSVLVCWSRFRWSSDGDFLSVTLVTCALGVTTFNLTSMLGSLLRNLLQTHSPLCCSIVMPFSHPADLFPVWALTYFPERISLLHCSFANTLFSHRPSITGCQAAEPSDSAPPSFMCASFSACCLSPYSFPHRLSTALWCPVRLVSQLCLFLLCLLFSLLRVYGQSLAFFHWCIFFCVVTLISNCFSPVSNYISFFFVISSVLSSLLSLFSWPYLLISICAASRYPYLYQFTMSMFW